MREDLSECSTILAVKDWAGKVKKEKHAQSSPGFAICLVKLVRDLYSDLYGPQKVADEGNSPAISGKSRLVKYYSIWPDMSLLGVLNTTIRRVL